MIFKKYVDVSSSSPSLTYIIIITIVTLTAILLISSPVMTVSSSPLMVLKVGLASASFEGGDGEQQQEGDNSQQQLPPAPHETPLQMPPAEVPPLQAIT